ncbi:hypothetical protein SAMN05421788_10528 [Filimonas lacunae]|uniref:Uncharacterized protein n=1 Tax=Filimonas lacunae TaxID=477680 RepID=A0A173MD58_9BACT|nr:hypothetical protein [Filimonas lacunae]BAV05524.1 hypothetical protein FLA_1531 [Filimonas lacunae]SIT20568.1 hypothetical protein SAMN05421788_10528 [Filimonas lacunae]
MTVADTYALLSSRSFYEKNGTKKFRFDARGLIIDRCASVPFFIYEESGSCYISISPGVFLESDLRIDCAHADGCTFHFYGKETGLEALVLE